MTGKTPLVTTPMYELQEQFQHLWDLLAEGEDEQTILDTLESVQMDINQKIQQTLYFHKNVEIEADYLSRRIDVLQKEIDRIREKENRLLNTAASVKQTVKKTMLLIKKRSLKYPEFTAFLTKKAGGVVVEDIDKLPDSVVVDAMIIELKKRSVSPRLKVIGDLLKNGAEIEGAKMGEPSDSLTIK